MHEREEGIGPSLGSAPLDSCSSVSRDSEGKHGGNTEKGGLSAFCMGCQQSAYAEF
jgi:hypothetical protein